jgi:CHAT domain-containing protein
MEAQIKDKKNLIIVPGGILAFVPFETLMDGNGQYLVGNHHINYVRSVARQCRIGRGLVSNQNTIKLPA